jgi:putative FmdB family regulatory protein
VPLFEYQCKKCKHRFEKIQKFSDSSRRKCPDCGGPADRMLSAPSVQFKGSGFYVTDYARKGESGDRESKPADASSASKAAEKSETKKTESSGESKAETKTETKTESKSKTESKLRKENR